MPQATVDRTSAAEFTITVELAPEDYQTRANAELKKLARTAKIKGFRPGKVPPAYMKKQYGRGIVLDAINKALDEAIKKTMEAERLDVFGQLQSVDEPDLSGLTADYAEPITFRFEGGLMPTIDDVDTEALRSIGRYTVALTDEEADKQIDLARKRHVEYLERDTVETEDDFATLVVSDPELDAKYYGEAGDAHSAEPTVGNDAKDGADAESAEHQHTDTDDKAEASTDADADDIEELEVEVEDDMTDGSDDDGDTEDDEQERDPRQRFFLRPSEMIEESRYKLVDKGRGTEVILALADLKEEARERYAKVIDADDTTTFTVAKVDHEAMPEHGEELYRKIFGEGTSVKTQDEARAAIREMFGANSQSNLDDFVLEQIIDALDEANPIDVPRAAIKARLEQARAEELESAQKENRDPEFGHDLTEADRYGFGRRLKWMAIRKALLERYDVELQTEDLDLMVEREYRQQLGGMGLDPDQFREQFFTTFKTNLLQNREKMMELTDELLTIKLLAKLEDEGVIAARRHASEAEFSEIVDEYNKRVGANLEALRAQPLG